MFAGCGSNSIETQIRKTYHNQYVKSIGIKLSAVYIAKNYGTYSDCVVVMMDANGLERAAVTGQEDVAGLIFGYAYVSKPILVFKDSKLISLTEAYDKEYLIIDNLQEILKIHNNL